MSKLREMYSDPRDKEKFPGPTMPEHEFITAGDSTVLMPVRRAGGSSEEGNSVELWAGRGPSNYRSDYEAQEDYDDLVAGEYSREERARQRGIASDMAYRATSLAPWLEDLEDATGLDAPDALNTVAEFAGPGDAKLLAMPWFIAKAAGKDVMRKMAYVPQHSLDAYGDPAGRSVIKYLDEGGAAPGTGIWDEGYEGTGNEILYANREDRLASEQAIEKRAKEAHARYAEKEAAKKEQIRKWAMGEGWDDTPLEPYLTPLERKRQEYELAARRRREEDDLYELLDAASRRPGLPAGEVVHDYVPPKRRLKNLYDGDPAKAERLYKHYPLDD